MNRKSAVLQPTPQYISNIAIDKIKESIITLRTNYNKQKLKELGDSIVDRGQIQTIVVQPDEKDPGYYELIIGSRRLRATRLKGKRYITAYVIEKRDPAELLLIALAENLHRDDLNPFEEARAFLQLTKEHELPPNEIAERVNKPLSYITGRLQLLTMPDEVIRMIADKQLPINSLRSLARLPSGDDQVHYARMMVKHRLSSPELSAQIRQELNELPRTGHYPHELTSVKLVARLRCFDKFIKKVPRRMSVERLNVTEKAEVKDVIEKLERSLKLLLNSLEITSTIMVSRSLPSHSDTETALNTGQEWTIKDIRRLTSPNRPSDPELALELGRTVAAIRSMRAKASQ